MHVSRVTVYISHLSIINQENQRLHILAYPMQSPSKHPCNIQRMLNTYTRQTVHTSHLKIIKQGKQRCLILAYLFHAEFPPSIRARSKISSKEKICLHHTLSAPKNSPNPRECALALCACLLSTPKSTNPLASTTSFKVTSSPPSLFSFLPPGFPPLTVH